ncbi:hypothetical protein CENSYa_0787 [Cenarchaeum symbiosum A]|uniref:Uncharacterized protein n=1 Tax=Cenarchaeum symbiosum (strain A) TaxID=414004 RepID=A0RVQ3_CENSY|nr:hypothetical protein CENSYa_0787 [Cenarchaeum symbiosum A]
MFKWAYATGTGLAAILAVLAFVPAGAQSTEDAQFYGMAEIVLRDGDEILKSQTVHNRLVDSGEQFILNSVFKTSASAITEQTRIDTICLSSTDVGAANEDDLSGTYSQPVSGSAGDPCKEIGNEDVNTEVITPGPGEPGYGTATLGPIRWQNIEDIGETGFIRGALVCIATGDTAFDSCGDLGTLFAAVDTDDINPTGDETVDITYVFDISSPNN